VGYWINADNPIGAEKELTGRSGYTSTGDQFYTTSVGYVGWITVNTNKAAMRPCRVSHLKRPAGLIALTDGVYAGKHGSNFKNTKDSRVGFRHKVNNVMVTNALYADGHVDTIPDDKFPLPYNATTVVALPGTTAPTFTAAQVKANHMQYGTIYANADKVIP
jgi:prepilin-type processing-associated H-X9-DG protein